MKHKKDDKVRIIANNSSHKFDIGEVVIVKTVYDNDLRYYATNEFDGWYIEESDCKTPTPTKLTRQHQGYKYSDGVEITPDKITFTDQKHTQRSLEVQIKRKVAELKTLRLGLRRFNDQNKRGWK